VKRSRRGLPAAPGQPARLPNAFTIVEMMVVIAIIGLILAIGVPAFNAMTTQQRLSKARQLLNGTLTRARVISISDRTLTAVRVFPAEWHLDQEAASSGSLAGRQMLATYSYRATHAANPSDPSAVLFDERFERIENGPTQLLPPDTWVAPSEALFDPGAGDSFDGDAILDGTIGYFTLDATDTREDFLSADDFLIVFDPETGVQTQRQLRPDWKAWRLLALDPRSDTPTGQLETDGVRYSDGTLRTPFQRYNFAGAVIYQREPFVAVGTASDGDDDLIDARRDVLRRFGQTYYVDRTGGNLVSGSGERPGGG
jgi:prepilin-type N-terminal cleavage/methylation domain-containing protein